MAMTEELYLLDCWERGICPYCRNTYPASARVGSGQKKKGGFCSLGCYTKYYELDIRERHRRIIESGGTNK
jgi:hypothetical protein